MFKLDLFAGAQKPPEMPPIQRRLTKPKHKSGDAAMTQSVRDRMCHQFSASLGSFLPLGATQHVKAIERTFWQRFGYDVRAYMIQIAGLFSYVGFLKKNNGTLQQLLEYSNSDFQKQTTIEAAYVDSQYQIETQKLFAQQDKLETAKLSSDQIDQELGHSANTTVMGRCKKCGHNKFSETQNIQTRSADEPMTVILTCERCGQKNK